MKKICWLIAALFVTVAATAQHSYNMQLNSPGYQVKGVKVSGFLSLPTVDGTTNPLWNPSDRLFRFNPATGTLEWHDGTMWHQVAEVDTTGLQLFAKNGLRLTDDTLYLGGEMTDSTDLVMRGDYLALRQAGPDSLGLYFLKQNEDGAAALRLQADSPDGALNRLDLMEGATLLKVTDAEELHTAEMRLAAAGFSVGVSTDTHTATLGLDTSALDVEFLATDPSLSGYGMGFHLNEDSLSVTSRTGGIQANRLLKVTPDGALSLPAYGSPAIGDSVLTTGPDGRLYNAAMPTGALYQGDGSTITLTGSTFAANSATALWNANQLQGIPLTFGLASSGDVLKYQSGAWVNAPDVHVNTATLSGGVLSLQQSGLSDVTVDLSALAPAGTWTLSGTKLYNNNTGNVLVGTTTDDGRHKLQVAGGTRIDGDVAITHLADSVNIWDRRYTWGTTTGSDNYRLSTVMSIDNSTETIVPQEGVNCYPAVISLEFDNAHNITVPSFNSTITAIRTNMVLSSLGATTNTPNSPLNAFSPQVLAFENGNYSDVASVRISQPFTYDVGKVPFTGTITNYYGIYLDDNITGTNSIDTHITNHYGIYQAGDDPNVFNGFVQIKRYTPTSSADPAGTVGTITADDNYYYFKTSTGWKRGALSTF